VEVTAAWLDDGSWRASCRISLYFLPVLTLLRQPSFPVAAIGNARAVIQERVWQLLGQRFAATLPTSAVSHPMKSLEDYYKWFSAKARELPYPDRLEVMNTVDTPDHRKMYIELLKLRESGKLPAEWNPVLDDFYGRFF
jgi:hypothetical protein